MRRRKTGTTRKGAMKGNRRTRSGMSPNDVGVSNFGYFQLRDESTKFYKRPPVYTTRAMWKKYPTPFVWDNPVPEGDAIIVRKFRKFFSGPGTYRKEAA